MKTTRPYTDIDALQARVAARLVVGLGEQTAHLPHDIGERLRVAREQAVQRGRATRKTSTHAVAVPTFLTQQNTALMGGGPPAWWQRVASALPLLVLLVGLQAITHWSVREQVLAAADLDSSLLADTLPPAAYTDPGFAEFLRSPPP